MPVLFVAAAFLQALKYDGNLSFCPRACILFTLGLQPSAWRYLTSLNKFTRVAVPGAEATIDPVAATQREKVFAAQVPFLVTKDDMLKAGPGTYFMGDQHYGFWSKFGEDDDDSAAAMLCIPPQYNKLWDRIQKLHSELGCRGFIVLGNPGIGKSHFCVYIAARSVFTV